MMGRREGTKEMEKSCSQITAIVLVKDGGSFVLMRQREDGKWAESGYLDRKVHRTE